MRFISLLTGFLFLGLVGAVQAATTSSQVLNDSTVAGNTVQAALNSIGFTLAQLNPRGTVSVLDPRFAGQIDPTGTTDSTAGLAAALAAVPTPGILYFPCGTYIGSLHPYRSQFAMIGAGSNCVTLKSPVASTWAAQPAGGVIEVGQTALGNGSPPIDGFVFKGFTIDGQQSLQPQASADDIHGWCMITASASHGTLDDVHAKNCAQGGLGIEINSNYWNIKATIDNSGLVGQYPCYDNNSSKFQNIDIITNGCTGAVRFLDNIVGINGRLVINNPKTIGLVFNNEPGLPFPPTPPLPAETTQLQANVASNLDVTVTGGAAFGGVQIGQYPNNFNMRITTQGVTGPGVLVVNTSQGLTHGCRLDINTYQSGQAGFDGTLNGCVINIVSEDDNYIQPFASSAAVILRPPSTGNKIDYTVTASGVYNSTFTASTSGTTMAVTAICTSCYGGGGYINVGQMVVSTGIPTYDYIVSQLTGTPGGVGTYQLNVAPSPAVASRTMNTQVSPQHAAIIYNGTTYNEISGRQIGPTALLFLCGYLDQTTSLTNNRFLTSGSGGVLASGNPLNIPESGDDFQISGTTPLAQIPICMNAGRRITLHFQGSLTIADISAGGSNNIQLSGHRVFKTYPGATITLETDGTNWYEVSRSRPIVTPLFNNIAMTTGSASTLSSLVDSYTLQASGTIASYTLILPPNSDQGSTSLPDGTLLTICTDVAITNLLVNANTGQSIKYSPTTLTAGQCFGERYTQSTTTWDIGM